jgi:hypothetical protein
LYYAFPIKLYGFVKDKNSFSLSCPTKARDGKGEMELFTSSSSLSQKIIYMLLENNFVHDPVYANVYVSQNGVRIRG